MKIEIIETNGSHIPVARTFPAKGDKPARTVFEQKAFAQMGGIFPVEFKITHDDHNDAYAVGVYELSPDSYKVNQYGQLELDRFGLKLIPASNVLDKKAS